jgi:methionine salvage enolase-phosphatase E1
VEAQKLFSKYIGVSKVVKEGEAEVQETDDLNPLFEANYDTVNAGPKMEKWSYELIAKEMGLKESEILFLSDNVKGKVYSPAVTNIMLTISRDPSSQRSRYASSPCRQTRQCDSLRRRFKDVSSYQIS